MKDKITSYPLANESTLSIGTSSDVALTWSYFILGYNVKIKKPTCTTMGELYREIKARKKLELPSNEEEFSKLIKSVKEEAHNFN
jgi:hypothetical protein